MVLIETGAKMSSYIDTDLNEGVFSLRLNRPDKKNALDTGMYQALADGIRQADQNPDVRVIYLCSSSADFCSGNDLKDFLKNPPADMNAPVFQFMQAIAFAEKPIAATVSGLAVGIGTTMLLHCDLVYADESAKFILPFVQLGVCAEAGSSLLLPMLLGHQRAAKALLGGEALSTEEALQAGFVSEQFGPGSLQEYALNKVRKLANQPLDALMTTKRLMKAPWQAQVEDAIRKESEEFMRLLNQDDAKAIMSAFFEN